MKATSKSPDSCEELLRQDGICKLKPLSHHSSILKAIPQRPRKIQVLCSSMVFVWRLCGVLCDVTASSTCHKCSANTVKVLCMHCWRHENTEHRQQELHRNAIECHASSVAILCSLLGRCDRPFFTKNIRVFLRSHGAPENLNNSVPTQWKHSLV